jgi:hypothetical protein
VECLSSRACGMRTTTYQHDQKAYWYDCRYSWHMQCTLANPERPHRQCRWELNKRHTIALFVVRLRMGRIRSIMKSKATTMLSLSVQGEIERRFNEFLPQRDANVLNSVAGQRGMRCQRGRGIWIGFFARVKEHQSKGSSRLWDRKVRFQKLWTALWSSRAHYGPPC